MSTCIKNMRQDRNDAELMSITGALQNIFTSYLEESSRKSMRVIPGYPAVTAVPSNSLPTPSCKIINIETTAYKLLLLPWFPNTRLTTKSSKSSAETCSNKKVSSTK